ncbi:MAG: hypothetical protein Q8K78_00720, partial [Planctomycetaceae bacterium]|nr:hypothetical protein [Planctomycetaceae bacterium]
AAAAMGTVTRESRPEQPLSAALHTENSTQSKQAIRNDIAKGIVWLRMVIEATHLSDAEAIW